MVLFPGCPCCPPDPLVIAVALNGWGESIDGVRPYDLNYVGMLTNPVPPALISVLVNSPEIYRTVGQQLSINAAGENFETFSFGQSISVSVKIDGEFFYLNLYTTHFPLRPQGITYRKTRIDSFDDIFQKKTVTFLPSDIVNSNGETDSTLADKAGSVILSTDYELFSGPSARSTFIVTSTPSEEVELIPAFFPGSCPPLFDERIFAYGNEEFSLTPSFVDNSVGGISFRNYEDVITDSLYEVRMRTVLFGANPFNVGQENDGRNYRFYFLANHRQINRTYRVVSNDEKTGAIYDCNDILVLRDGISDQFYFTGFDSVAMRLIGSEDKKITISSPLAASRTFVGSFTNPFIGSNPHTYTFEWIPDEE